MFNYKKIIVIGCSGAGKSTFSRRLHEITKIDLYNLDTLYWKRDGSHIQRSELIEKQERIIGGDKWIIDGNFRNTLEMRIRNADLIFFFDLPTEVCINGAVTRGERPELPFKLPVNDELIDFIKDFNTDVKPKILELFEKYNSNVITFKSHRQADDYLYKIKDFLEEWDVYDSERNVIPDKIILRGVNEFEPGEYHLVVHVCVFNSDGKMLIQQRQPFKSIYSGMWDITCGGSAVRGENSCQAAERELSEEVGIIYDFSDVRPKLTVNYDNGFDDYYLIEKDLCLETLELQYDEVKAVKWASCNEIKELISQGKFIPYYPHFIETLFSMKKSYGPVRDWKPGD